MSSSNLIYLLNLVMTVLGRKFFERNTPLVAKELLGKKIIRVYRGKKIEGIITETEAYHGFEDKASHASRGKTERTKVMFGEAGTIYVYLIYGMHYCLNIVTEKKNYPAAVLIRGIYANGKAINGPGRVCRFLKIDKKLNEKPLSRKSGIWIEEGIKIIPKKIIKSTRIGVDYAGPIWSEKLWRFCIKSAKV